jgi:hypothetical protein
MPSFYQKDIDCQFPGVILLVMVPHDELSDCIICILEVPKGSRRPRITQRRFDAIVAAWEKGGRKILGDKQTRKIIANLRGRSAPSRQSR